ncbi:MAG: hydrogenase nickel incorporation protein HybF [Syntrophaceae bacterium PtaU1.Bin231]|nr:MAG: hydrogenase nickel incorporation protein HybF [Syntrophaceae bacterium PtaU1.Bin231]
MHELSLALSILDMVDEYAEVHRFVKVNSITLSFGRMSCIEPKSLQFAFEVESRGRLAEGATLTFEVLPAGIHCFSCGQDSETDGFAATCPRCLGEEVVLTGGTEELRVLELDVD